MLTQIDDVRKNAIAELKDGADRAEWQLKYLGRKGALTSILRQISTLSDQEKIDIGSRANRLKQELTNLFSSSSHTISINNVDYSLPPLPAEYGTVHPVSAMVEEMTNIFKELSFEIVEGNQIVTEIDNFDMLNFQPEHPARDSHDSFNLENKTLLRTHTSSIQVVEMQARAKRKQIPIRIVAPGKTYRRESDPTHSMMFHQMEALIVDNQTTLSDLKGIFNYTITRLFGPGIKTRFRPHYFPFTEPSAELDLLWKDPLTGQERWLEIAGCGMIHPNVLKNAGINPRVYQGWAFGMAVERQIMIRHNIQDIRLFYQNSLPFLNQFTPPL